MPTEYWPKEADKHPAMAWEVNAMRDAYSKLATAVERLEEQSKRTEVTVTAVQKELLVLTTQRAEEKKHECPQPGACLSIKETMLKIDARLAATEKEINWYGGAIKVLAVIFTAVTAGVIKLLFDSGGKHP